MKQAYRVAYGDYGRYWVKIELTGLCKKVTGGPDAPEEPMFYRQAQYRLFGIPLFKYWLRDYEVELFDAVKESIYECAIDCSKPEKNSNNEQ